MKLNSRNIKKLISKKDRELMTGFLSESNSKDNQRDIENNEYQNKLVLLEQERQKRYNELFLWYQNEKKKIILQHTQKMKVIDLQ